MPTDLTGTPTSLGIGTYNTSVDAPSGLGFNAAMAQIDALIAARVTKPAGVLTVGEVPVWNGTTWVRSSTTQVGPTSLGTGVLAISTFLRSDGQWSNLAPYRKTTTKAVNTSITATDLLNGEITVGANVMGTAGAVRLNAWGDFLQNTGVAAAPPKFQLLFGGATIFDTNALGAVLATSAARNSWTLTATILNTGSAAAQAAMISFEIEANNGATAGAALFTTGGGIYQTVYNGSNSFMVKGVGSTTSGVNTALASALVLNVVNGTNSVNYETKLYGAVVEVI